jgi:hypothetical protein
MNRWCVAWDLCDIRHHERKPGEERSGGHPPSQRVNAKIHAHCCGVLFDIERCNSTGKIKLKLPRLKKTQHTTIFFTVSIITCHGFSHLCFFFFDEVFDEAADGEEGRHRERQPQKVAHCEVKYVLVVCLGHGQPVR